MPKKKKVLNETEEERKIREAQEQIREAEVARRKQEQLRAALLARQQEDATPAAVSNAMQLDEAWRRLMRREKLTELKADTELLSQWFERQLDRRDSTLAKLQAEVDELSNGTGPWADAFRAHMLALEKLKELSLRSMDKLRKDFDAEVGELRGEHSKERKELLQSQLHREGELAAVIGAMEAEWRVKQAQSRKQFAQALQEAKEKGSEELVQVRRHLERRIVAAQEAFARARREYAENVEPRIKQFDEAREAYEKKMWELRSNELKLARLQEELTQWRASGASHTKEFEARRALMAQENEMVADHFRRLKTRMSKYRDIQKQRLVEMAKLSAESLREVESRTSVAEELLHISEVVEKLKTEEEKVLGFKQLDEVVPVAALGVPPEIQEEPPSLLQTEPAQPEDDYSTSALDCKGERVIEATAMENFFKLYNKGLADKEALEHEQTVLQHESEDLKAILKECADGMSLNDGLTENSLGTLMIVNNKMPPRIRILEGDAAATEQAAHVVYMAKSNM